MSLQDTSSLDQTTRSPAPWPLYGPGKCLSVDLAGYSATLTSTHSQQIPTLPPLRRLAGWTASAQEPLRPSAP